ncbi:MAG TPA: DUF222 domain-containing protein [Acidimicrobiia bacterium]|nr:DUF222 domain-containing protein [Acidimicrobiia bacterium]
MDAAVETALAEVPLERLEAEITELAAHLAAAECRWLLLIGEFDRREGYSEWGCRSTAHWLSWRCGLSLRAGYERVRVARALDTLPAITEAFATARLSYSKVRALTKIATPETEKDWVDVALHATAAQVERLVSGCEASDRDAARIHHERGLRIVRHDDGSGTIVVDLPPEKMAVVEAALQAEAESMAIDDFVAEVDECSAEHTSDPSDVWTARLADALVRMAERALDPHAPERSFSERFLVNVHVDAATGEGEIERGGVLSPDTVGRLLCDAPIVAIAEIEGTPVHAGTKTQTIPRAMRRALKARDRGCRFPGCTNTRWVDAHHIVWQSKGGPTELWNLVLLCRFHHTSIHHRGFTIEITADGLRFFRPDGTELHPAPSLPGAVDAHLSAVKTRWN